MQRNGESDADTCAYNDKMFDYARTHGGPDVTVAPGTEPFTGSIVG